MYEKESERIDKYQDLKRENEKLWEIRQQEVISVVVGALGAVSKRLETWFDKLEIAIRTALLQETALLGTARISRRVLER